MDTISKRLLKLNTINDRTDYLRKIINREIQLKPGQMEWLSNPCEIKKSVTSSGGKFLKIGGGAYGKIFNVCIDELCDYEFALKEIQYSDDKNYLGNGNPYRSENVEVKIFKLLNELVINGLTPHIPLYMGDFNCMIKGVEYKYIMVEKADYNLTTAGLLSNNEKVRNILFQILYTLKIIHKHYPAFIHNDMKPNNILIFNSLTENDKYYKYILNETTYYLPNNSRAAIWDFGTSSIICEKCDNALTHDLITEQKLGLQTEQNQYKDIFKLFDSLLYRKHLLSEESKNFINEFHYKTDQVDDYHNLIPNIEPFTIDQMLNHSYFDVFKIPVPDNQIIETYQDKSILEKITSKISSNPVFECSWYEDNKIVYYEYRDPKYNDLNRITCDTSTKEFILEADNPELLSIVSKSYYSDNIMDFGLKKIVDFGKISDDDKKKIIELYYDLIIKFIKHTYVPYVDQILSDVLKLVILNKSVFLVTKIHHQIILSSAFKYIDYSIQFNQFLCNGY